ncbi:MAG: hypothetical protein AAB573_03095 [Patescibacteria group bacterium]
MNTPNAILWIVLIVAIILFAGFVLWGSTSAFSLFVPNYGSPTQALQAVGETQNNDAFVPQRVTEDDRTVTIVNYTGSRFVPQVITVNRGDTVRFVNKDNLSMRITSQDLKFVPLYPGFDQADSVGTGEYYEFVFNDPGVWPYHNMNSDPGTVGVIYVR